MLRSCDFSTRMIRKNWSGRGSWCGMTIIRIWKQCSRSTYPNLTMRNSIFGCHEAQNKCLPESRARKPLMPQPWPESGAVHELGARQASGKNRLSHTARPGKPDHRRMPPRFGQTSLPQPALNHAIRLYNKTSICKCDCAMEFGVEGPRRANALARSCGIGGNPGKQIGHRAGKTRQERRYQRVLLFQSHSQNEARILAPKDFDLPAPPVDDPVFVDAAA